MPSQTATRWRPFLLSWCLLVLASLASHGASAQPRFCDDPSGHCGQSLSESCLERVGAGSLAVGAETAETDLSAAECASQFDKYRECLASIAEACPAAVEMAPQNGGDTVPLKELTADDFYVEQSVRSARTSLTYRLRFAPASQIVAQSLDRARLRYALDSAPSERTSLSKFIEVTNAPPPTTASLIIESRDGRIQHRFNYQVDFSQEIEPIVSREFGASWITCRNARLSTLSSCSLKLGPALRSTAQKIAFESAVSGFAGTLDLSDPARSEAVFLTDGVDHVIVPTSKRDLSVRLQFRDGAWSEPKDLATPSRRQDYGSIDQFVLRATDPTAPPVFAELARADRGGVWTLALVSGESIERAGWRHADQSTGVFSKSSGVWVSSVDAREIQQQQGAAEPFLISIRFDDGSSQSFRYSADWATWMQRARVDAIKSTDVKELINCRGNERRSWSPAEAPVKVVCEFRMVIPPGDVFDKIYWGVDPTNLADLDDFSVDAILAQLDPAAQDQPAAAETGVRGGLGRVATPIRESTVSNVARRSVAGADASRTPPPAAPSDMRGQLEARYGDWRMRLRRPSVRDETFLGLTEVVDKLFFRVVYGDGEESEIATVNVGMF